MRTNLNRKITEYGPTKKSVASVLNFANVCDIVVVSNVYRFCLSDMSSTCFDMVCSVS